MSTITAVIAVAVLTAAILFALAVHIIREESRGGDE
jgi:hypothetical protein